MADNTSDLNNLLLDLRQAGQEPDRALLERIKGVGAAAVPPLIEMALDERLHQAEADDPAGWAPLHAIRLLGQLEAVEAVQPLLGLLRRDEPWVGQTLPEYFGRVGRPALEPLRVLLFDRGQGLWPRVWAASGLGKMGQHHAELRAEVVAALAARLDPAESQVPEDEELNAFVVSDLLDLHAEEAGPAILRAFEEDRVDRRIVGPESVEEELGLEVERPDGTPADESGLRLWLRCTACGYVRQHAVGRVYCDLPTQERRRRGEKPPYSEFIIIQRITCPRCGAVDRYEHTSDTSLALTAELFKLAAQARGGEAASELGEPRLILTRFTLDDGREMHPLEARDMYRQQVEAAPARADLRVRYANVLRFLGYWEEAIHQYDMALGLDPNNVEACANLGNILRAAGQHAKARGMFQRVLALASTNRLSSEEREKYFRWATDALAELRAGDPAMQRPTQPVLEPAFAPGQPARAVRKVGRNEPCPCGSGKKYKRCCGG